MTIYEKDAVVEYLEFNLLVLCESLEEHMDPDAIGSLYENAYQLLNDMDQTLEQRVETVALEQFINNYRS